MIIYGIVLVTEERKCYNMDLFFLLEENCKKKVEELNSTVDGMSTVLYYYCKEFKTQDEGVFPVTADDEG